MLLEEIKSIAEQKGVAMQNLRTKKDFIHAIQNAEGNQQCYGLGNECNNDDCCWHSDCMKHNHENRKIGKRKRKKVKKHL
ncbi:hypothetical protein [Pectinatus sottacetonis]|uniref:hypothetical protein n=1 Tax=Pectinatus sottacetonis TaxID=1002795 RepID=UPI0018C57513|nr:hypothetical protein [Pectinatus sottacetonis]